MHIRRFVAAIAASASVAVPSAAVAQSPGATPSAAKRAHTITLVTGDRVVLTDLAGGKHAVTVNGNTTASKRAGVFKTFRTVERDGQVYAYPVELMPYIGTLLDRELFNLTKLVEQGYADRASTSIPLIVSYRGAAGGATPAGMTRTRQLESIDAVAGKERKSRARSLGQALKRQLDADGPAIRRGRTARYAQTGPLAGIKMIHLDQQIKAALADSVPQIGAPHAWAAGFDGTGIDVAVLDTGIDTTHPDLAGKVVAERNFTPEATATDGNGHGTHVSSTVAGGGQASNGLRKGVAPGARLMNGKVLDSTGNGQVSWAIDAMEWASSNGAEVISMSLEAGVSDGTDPFSQAVNDLSESRGVLFTIAAGNFGSAAQTITAPGTADKALTVGAVDKSNVLAGFSSRGPRLGDNAIKPDITAPGVNIVAARAAGTALGPIVDDVYTMISGTSMATPHVAGSAAILKQEFPDWTPQQIKAALESTAAPGPYTIYEQGGGRVDVARAFSQKVYATTAPVDFGFFRFPQTDVQPVTKTIGYDNETEAQVTLDLAVEVADAAGNPAPAGMVTTSAPSVTVPAGGTANIDVTTDVRGGAAGLYGGYVTARSADGNVVVRTPVGFFKEPESYNLTVRGTERDGRPADGRSGIGIDWVDVVDVNDTTRYQQTRAFENGTATFRVPVGTYSVMGNVFTYDAPHVFAIEDAVVGDPEVEVTQDTTVDADARKATEVIADTDRPTKPIAWVTGTYRGGAERGSWESLLLASPPISRIFAAPTEQVTKGDFGWRAKPNLFAPELEVSVAQPEDIPLDVRYASGSPKLDGRDRRQVVYVGIGRPEDYNGRDVRGKAVLISRGTLTFADKVANAAAHDPAMIIIHNNVPGLLLIGLASDPGIPVLSTSLSQGQLLQGLLENGRVVLAARGIPQEKSPYVYDVIFSDRGRIQDTHRRTVDRSNTVRTHATYHAGTEGWVGGEAHHAYPPFSGFSSDFARNLITPLDRTEYTGIGDARWQHVGWASMAPFEFVFQGGLQAPIQTYPRAANRSAEWFRQPQWPAVIRNWEVGDNGEPVTRTGNAIQAFVPEFVDSDQRFGFSDGNNTSRFRLFENGEQIAETTGWRGTYPVSGDPATYRAELSVERTAPFWTMSTDSDTAWTFRSAPPAEGVTAAVPLLLADYDVGVLDALNRAPRGSFPIDVAIHRQQGAPAAAITDARLWASFDDGGTWRRVDLTDRGGGNFTATVAHPAAASRKFVSLRLQATDAGGSAITQTIIRAYGLV